MHKVFFLYTMLRTLISISFWWSRFIFMCINISNIVQFLNLLYKQNPFSSGGRNINCRISLKYLLSLRDLRFLVTFGWAYVFVMKNMNTRCIKESSLIFDASAHMMRCAVATLVVTYSSSIIIIICVSRYHRHRKLPVPQYLFIILSGMYNIRRVRSETTFGNKINIGYGNDNDDDHHPLL